MADRVYTNFDLVVSKRNGGYHLVAESEEGQAQVQAELKVPFAGDERDTICQMLQGPARDLALSGKDRKKAGDYWEELKKYGERLYDAVFTAPVMGLFSIQSDRAQKREGAGVRIRVKLDEAPELADLPWEYLYKQQRFLALDDFSPIVRHLNHPDPVPSPLVRPPLSVLVMVAKADTALDVEKEWGNVQSALRPLVDRKLVMLRRVAATKQEVDNALQQDKICHVLHFVGHSGLLQPDNKPVLRLDDADVPADYLTDRVDPRSLRLVLLNSCDSARSAKDDAFAGLAHDFVRLGVTAVVAMQFKITDEAAIRFSGGFYGALTEQSGIDVSVTRGRGAIRGPNSNPTEWGTPVLFLRGKGNQLFTFDVPGQQQAQQMQIDRLVEQAEKAIEQRQYDIAIAKLTKAKEITAKMLDDP